MEGTTLELLLGRCFRRAEPNYENFAGGCEQNRWPRAARRSVEHFNSGRMLDTLRLLNIPVVAIHRLEDPLMPPPRDEVLNYIDARKRTNARPCAFAQCSPFPDAGR